MKTRQRVNQGNEIFAEERQAKLALREEIAQANYVVQLENKMQLERDG